MSYRFIKLSCDITKSTIWAEDDATFRIWVWMLAEADRSGVVRATIPGIALACRKTIPETEAALMKFEGPDPYSSNPANEGRRLERVKGGWRLLNYAEHRDRQGGDPDWQKERNRLKQAAFRERQKQPKPIQEDATVTELNGDVTRLRNQNPVIVTTEAEAEAETNPTRVVEVSSIAQLPLSGVVEESPKAPKPAPPAKKYTDPIEAIYQAYPRLVGKRKAVEAITRAVDRLMANEQQAKAPTKLEAQRWLYSVTKRYSESPAGNRGNLTPHPATWFNQSRYLDNPSEWEREETPHGSTKHDSNNRNIAAAREFIQDVTARRGDTAGSAGPEFGLPAASGARQGDIRALPRESGDAGTTPTSHGIQPGAVGEPRILPHAGQAAGTGGRRNAGVPW